MAALLVGTVFFAAHAWIQQSTQERQLWEVRLARDAQANSTITIQNHCQQPHNFNVIQQQTPFLQLLAGPLVNVPGNSSYTLPVRFNTNGMNVGQYQGTVIVKCETCGKEKGCKQDREILPIRLTVVENAKPPQAVSTEPITATATPTPTPSLGAAHPAPSPSPSPSPSPCAPTPTPTTYTLKNLSTLSESDTAHCVAAGINDGGNVVGACSPSYFGKSGGAWHAFRTEPGSVITKKDWILIAAFDINDAKEIVGRALDLHLGKYHAFLLKSKGVKPIDLGALKEDIYDSSAAYAINTCGETVPLIDKVVGYTYTKKDAHYGFVWTEGVGMKDMGTLTGYLESYAQAINKKGEVVGAVGGLHTSVIFDAITCLGTCFTTPTGDAKNHAVWYNGIELKDLNKLIPAYPGWEIEFANSINNKYGQIVGSGFYKPPTYKSGGLYAKAVLLSPAGLTLPGSIATTTGTSTACPLSIPSGGYIFDNWNVCGVKNGPTKETTFTIDAPYLITFIATYHWNYGKGALPTKGISLKDSSGKVYGPWPVITSAGSGGAANVNWECHPGITLPAGTYTVIDPDPATWSQNDGSGNVGFARVAGAIKK